MSASIPQGKLPSISDVSKFLANISNHYRPGRRTEANTRREGSHIFVILEAHRSVLTALSAPLEKRVPTIWHIVSEQSLAQSKVKSPNEIDSSKPVDAEGSACALSTLEALARQTSGDDARVWHLRP